MGQVIRRREDEQRERPFERTRRIYTVYDVVMINVLTINLVISFLFTPSFLTFFLDEIMSSPSSDDLLLFFRSTGSSSPVVVVVVVIVAAVVTAKTVDDGSPLSSLNSTAAAVSLVSFWD